MKSPKGLRLVVAGLAAALALTACSSSSTAGNSSSTTAASSSAAAAAPAVSGGASSSAPPSAAVSVPASSASAGAPAVSGGASSSASSSAAVSAPASSAGASGSTTASGSATAAGTVTAGDVKTPLVATNIPAGSTMAKIKASGKLRIGGSLDAPLLSQQNPATGKLEGFDAEIGQLLSTYIFGTPDKVEIVSAGTQTREALLQNHTADVVIQTYSITAARAKQVSFAGPYLETGLQIVVKKGTAGISTPADLAGKTVIAGSNTPAIDSIKKAAPSAKIVTFDDDPSCIQALQQGRGDAYVQGAEIIAGDLLNATDLKAVGSQFDVAPEGIGVPLNQPDMLAFTNTFLKGIIANGQWAKAWKDTFGSVGIPTPTPPTVGHAGS